MKPVDQTNKTVRLILLGLAGLLLILLLPKLIQLARRIWLHWIILKP